MTFFVALADNWKCMATFHCLKGSPLYLVNIDSASCLSSQPLYSTQPIPPCPLPSPSQHAAFIRLIWCVCVCVRVSWREHN